MAAVRMLLLPLLIMAICCWEIHVASAETDGYDAAILQSLTDEWENLPPSWGNTNDPCGGKWEGVNCTGSRVTALELSTMNLKGKLGGDISGLTELKTLDLSYNRGLTGSMSPSIGNLKKLNILILTGCGFTGIIPNEIGNLTELSFLALNSNNFFGTIPPSLGLLSELYFLDIADNQLTGHLPISTTNSPGLDQLLKTKHFHFGKNRLSGSILNKLFSSQMVLIHILFDGNQLIGEIPPSIGLVKTIEVLRLDRNSLGGQVPSTLNNLKSISQLYLSNNRLEGPIPDLTGMSSLIYVDLSNNTFDPSEAPIWFSTIQSLTTLVMEDVKLQGLVPQVLFSFPHLQQVKLRNNQFNETLDMGKNISQQLRIIDFESNNISALTLGSGYTNILILKGNPVCQTILSNTKYCQLQQEQQKVYSTSLASCGSKGTLFPGFVQCYTIQLAGNEPLG